MREQGRATRRVMSALAALFVGVALAEAGFARELTIVMISLDGTRPSDVRPDTLPTVLRLAERGLRVERLVPSRPTNTFPNHVTLVTGVAPERHGIVNNVFIDPERGMFKKENIPDWIEVEPLWSLLDRAGIPTASFHWVGSEGPGRAAEGRDTGSRSRAPRASARRSSRFSPGSISKTRPSALASSRAGSTEPIMPATARGPTPKPWRGAYASKTSLSPRWSRGSKSAVGRTRRCCSSSATMACARRSARSTSAAPSKRRESRLTCSGSAALRGFISQATFPQATGAAQERRQSRSWRPSGAISISRSLGGRGLRSICGSTTRGSETLSRWHLPGPRSFTRSSRSSAITATIQASPAWRRSSLHPAGGVGALPMLPPIHSIDVAPTVLALLGVEVPEWMEGQPIRALVSAAREGKSGTSGADASSTLADLHTISGPCSTEDLPQ